MFLCLNYICKLISVVKCCGLTSTSNKRARTKACFYTFLVSTRKRLVRGAVPTLNLPVKSVTPTPVTPRREPVRQEIGMPVVYKNLKQFRTKIFNVKMVGWSKTEETDSVVFEFLHPIYALPKLSLSVASGLNFSVAVYNLLLPDNHFIYKDTKRSLQFTTISTMMSTLEEAKICEGLVKNELTNSICEDPFSSQGSSSIIRHTVPIQRQHYDEDGPSFQAHVFIRSENCEVLCNDVPCVNCFEAEKSLGKVMEETAKRSRQPLPSKAPLTVSGKERLVATVQKQRTVCKELESRIVDLEKEIAKNSIHVDETLEKDMLAILVKMR